ncbi:MAG TPA: SDR family NAD(P)-dependent oxidoreductase, partial [Thermoanaerobaculia bacterium]|nr:SDR family NAD(P)-dependent oxidoreductase [Thermoanaerobaculia bacterium]
MAPDFDRASVLVTGGAGFIGSHLVDALLARGADVRVLDDLSTGSRRNLAHCEGRIDFRVGDIRDPDACREAMRGVRWVFHQAALGSVPRSLEDPGTTIDVNVTGTARIFAAAREAGVRRVVYASSSSVYGDSAKLPKREGEEGTPLSPYALSKRMDEELADGFQRSFGMELVGLRYFNVYGPRQSPDGAYA